MTRRAVVVTAASVVSPLGVGLKAFAENLLAGKSGVGMLSGFDASSLPVRIAGEVRDFDPRPYVQPRKALKLMARDIQMGVVAARLLATESGVPLDQFDPTRLGVVFGSDMVQNALEDVYALYHACLVEDASPASILQQFAPRGAFAGACSTLADDGRRFEFDRWGGEMSGRVFPLFMLKHLPNMAACQASIALNAQGPSNSVLQAEASSLLAIQEAARIIERGAADVMVAGGMGTRITPLVFVQSILGRQLSRRNDAPELACRPFDVARDGMVMGEGGGALLLESEEHALARGAKPLARIVGSGAACVSRSNPNYQPGKSLRLALARALADSGWSASDVGSVNADGYGAAAGDQVEAEAIRDVLGSDVPVFAAKGYFGNLGAGSGAVELAASLVGMQHGLVPATLNCEELDPRCPVNVVRREPLPGKAADRILKFNQSLEGQAVAVALERWTGS